MYLDGKTRLNMLLAFAAPPVIVALAILACGLLR